MAMGMMLGQLARSWGWIVLRGVAAIVFGVLAFAWPGLTLTVLVLLWGVYAFADGLLALFVAFQLRDGGRPMWTLLLIGLLGIGAGVVTFLRPNMTALVLLAFIAAWALFTGFLQILAAIRFRKFITNEWMLVLSGALSVVFGALLLARPGAGAMAVVWIIGGYAVLFGLFLTMLGLRLKSLTSSIPKVA